MFQHLLPKSQFNTNTGCFEESSIHQIGSMYQIRILGLRPISVMELTILRDSSVWPRWTFRFLKSCVSCQRLKDRSSSMCRWSLSDTLRKSIIEGTLLMLEQKEFLLWYQLEISFAILKQQIMIRTPTSKLFLLSQLSILKLLNLVERQFEELCAQGVGISKRSIPSKHEPFM